MKSPIQDGPLRRYISRSLAAYREPVRKGTPKGDAIGFSRAKYAAALFTLTNLSVPQIATCAGTTVGVVRVWRTQLAFKHAVENHAANFADEIIEMINERCADDRRRFREFWATASLQKIAQGRAGNVTMADLEADVTHWSQQIVMAILAKVKPLKPWRDAASFIEMVEAHDPWHCALLIADRWCLINEQESVMAPLLAEMAQEGQGAIAAREIESALSIVTAPSATAEQRKEAAYLLGRVRDRVMSLRWPSMLSQLRVRDELARREKEKRNKRRAK